MATPRHQLIDPDYPMHYHIVSRCVRRSWLCGVDRLARKDYEHRKDWLEQRMWHLAQQFSVAIDAFAIMSNHFSFGCVFRSTGKLSMVRRGSCRALVASVSTRDNRHV